MRIYQAPRISFARALKLAEYIPEHYNRTCRATIPSCWVIRVDGWELGSGDSREEAARVAAA